MKYTDNMEVQRVESKLYQKHHQMFGGEITSFFRVRSKIVNDKNSSIKKKF